MSQTDDGRTCHTEGGALPALAVVGGAAILAACRDDAPREVDDAGLPLTSGMHIPIVESSIQDLRLSLPTDFGFGDDKLVMVNALGAWEAGDGGGGFFVWDPSPVPSGVSDVDLEGVYNTLGTVIRPRGVLPAEAGRWRRVYSGPVDIRWFRAEGGPWTEAFRRALGVLSRKWGIPGYSPPGGELYIPPGTYEVDEPLIPTPADAVAGLAVVGSGRDDTEILFTSTDAERALFELDPGTVNYESMRFQDITLRRIGRGRVLNHAVDAAASTTEQDLNGHRLVHFTFERVVIEEGLSGVSDYPVVELTRVFSSTWEDVVVRAATLGILLGVSARNHLSLVRVEPPPGGTPPAVGIVFGSPPTAGLSGGAHVLHRPSITAKTGIVLQRVLGVTVVEPTFSSSEVNIEIAGSYDTVILSPHFKASTAALLLRGDPAPTVNVQVRGGCFEPVGAGLLIQAEAVRSVGVEGLSCAIPAGSLEGRVLVSDVSWDVRVDVTHDTGRSEVRRELRPGDTGATLCLGPSRAGVVLGPTGPIEVSQIIAGHGVASSTSAPPRPGQRVSLFFENDNVTLVTTTGGEGPVILNGGAPSWSAPAGSMVELVFDGEAWRELRRFEGAVV